MGISGAVLMGASAVAGGISRYSSSKVNASFNEQNARFADQQAEFSDRQADDALLRGEDTVNILRMRVRQAIGTARSSYAAQGVEVDDGSSADVTRGMSWVGERDALTIRNNAAREAWGYKLQGWGARVDAWNYRTGAALDRSRARQEIPNTILGVAGVAYNSGAFSGFGRGGGGRGSGFGFSGSNRAAPYTPGVDI